MYIIAIGISFVHAMKVTYRYYNCSQRVLYPLLLTSMPAYYLCVQNILENQTTVSFVSSSTYINLFLIIPMLRMELKIVHYISEDIIDGQL